MLDNHPISPKKRRRSKDKLTRKSSCTSPLLVEPPTSGETGGAHDLNNKPAVGQEPHIVHGGKKKQSKLEDEEIPTGPQSQVENREGENKDKKHKRKEKEDQLLNVATEETELSNEEQGKTLRKNTKSRKQGKKDLEEGDSSSALEQDVNRETELSNEEQETTPRKKRKSKKKKKKPAEETATFSGLEQEASQDSDMESLDGYLAPIESSPDGSHGKGEEWDGSTASPTRRTNAEDGTAMAFDQEEEDRALRELKEFIPNVKSKSSTTVHKMIMYDLPRFREFKRQGLVLHQGRYSTQENKRLIQNVKDFLDLTGIESATKLFFPKRYSEERAQIMQLKSQYKFHAKIADGIPRPWHDVYARGRKIFDTFNYKGRFTKDETKSLLKLHKLHGNNWMKIAELTGRSNYSLEKKFLQMGQNRGAWAEDEVRRLTRAIRAHVEELAEPSPAGGSGAATVRREQLYSRLPWADVAGKVETRSWTQCRSKWMAILKQKMTVEEPVFRKKKSTKTNAKLIRVLYEMQIEDAADLNWEEVTQSIGRLPPAYLQTRFYKLKLAHVPMWQTLSFGDIIDYLYEKVLPKLEQSLQSCKEETGEDSQSNEQEIFRLSEIFDDDDNDVSE